MNQRTYAFTLIEMLIVIMIVAILITIVMAFGENFIRDIQARQMREERVADYTIMRGKLLLSSYNNGIAISGVTLSFDNGAMVHTMTSKDGQSTVHTFSYSGMSIQGPARTISLVPYRLSCDNTSNKKKLSTPISQIRIQNETMEQQRESPIRLTFDASDKNYCYHLDSTTCKISRLSSCPSEE